MKHFILTEAQADGVRGETSVSAALDPRPLANGTEWALPLSVATDPAHAMRHAFLGSLPIRDLGPADWPADPEA